METWITCAGTIKSSSTAEKTVHGLHYNTTTRVYKETFDAIVQMRTENITNNYDNIDEVLKQNLVKLTKNIDISNVTNFFQLNEFKKLEEQIVDSNSLQSRMTVMLLKGISLLFSIFSTAENLALTFTCNVRSNTPITLYVQHSNT